MDFTGILSLSYNRTTEFLGQETHPHRYLTDITIKTLETGISTAFNVPILINGIPLGSGNIRVSDERSVDFLTGQLAQTAIVSIYSGAFASYLGISSLESIKTLDESYEERKNEDNSISTTHNLNVVLENRTDLLDTAISIASSLRKNYGLRKTYFNEKFNLIDGAYSFVESSKDYDGSPEYIANISHSLSLGEDGNTTVTESVEIIGLQLPLDVSADNGLTAKIALAFSRCDNYASLGGSSHPLNPNPTIKSITKNKFLGKNNYSITFTNNPSLLSTYSWEYTTTLDYDELRNGTATENGRILGFGDIRSSKYAAAIAGFSTVKKDIFSRLSTYLPDILNEPIEKTENKSEFRGSIEYTYRYTNDQTFIINGQFYREEYTIEEKEPQNIRNIFMALGRGAVIQDSLQSSIGEIIQTAKILGKRSSGTMSDYLNYTKNKLGIPKKACYLTSEVYSLSPTQYDFNYNATYYYFKPVVSAIFKPDPGKRKII